MTIDMECVPLNTHLIRTLLILDMREWMALRDCMPENSCDLMSFTRWAMKSLTPEERLHLFQDSLQEAMNPEPP